MESLEQLYKPIIQKIIDDNRRFYGFQQIIEWDFFANENVAIVGMVSNNLKLQINLYSVEVAYTRNEPLNIEYFILHEIRHIYQRLFILYCRQNYIEDISAIQWERELNGYISIEQDENTYYNQSIEFDAFCYSYAVMMYKYGKVPYIDYPKFYHLTDEFDNKVSKWMRIFESQNL